MKVQQCKSAWQHGSQEWLRTCDCGVEHPLSSLVKLAARLVTRVLVVEARAECLDKQQAEVALLSARGRKHSVQELVHSFHLAVGIK